MLEISRPIIVEGKYGNITLEGNRWARDKYIRKQFLEDNGLETGNILNIKDVQNSLHEVNSLGYVKGAITLQDSEESVEYTDVIYNGLTFHRVIQDFMVQGGDPKADGTGGNVGKDGNKINIKGEFLSNGHQNDISHKYGVISMARSGEPDSASSQFFICNADASSSLDGSYAAFGYVVEGMSVIDEMTKDVFPKTAYYDYYMQYMLTGNTTYYYYWSQIGNGALESKADQPVIKYIKVLDKWEK